MGTSGCEVPSAAGWGEFMVGGRGEGRSGETREGAFDSYQSGVTRGSWDIQRRNSGEWALIDFDKVTERG